MEGSVKVVEAVVVAVSVFSLSSFFVSQRESVMYIYSSLGSLRFCRHVL